jgi:PAS domain S-box-containing protein
MLRTVFALGLIVLLTMPAGLGAVEAPRVRRVLILHSFGRDFAPFDAASSGFRTELARQSAAPIEFLEASLETARFVEGRSEIPFVEYLRALFVERPPHLLVPFGAPAMNFLIRHRDKLFPGVPLLVGTVDKRLLNRVKLGVNATAVGVDLDLPGIIENILRILPGTTNIEVVIGNSPLERFWLAELRQDLRPFANRVRFSWLNDLSFEEMRKRVATLPRNTAVLYAVLLVDAEGVPHEQERALELLRRDSNVPIFGAFDSQLGRGIVGGPLYPVQDVSRESARLAVRILNGESPGSIQPVLLSSSTPAYDWRELKRWNISENRLPPGSVVRFKEPTLWEQYRWYIIAALAIIAIQAAMIGDLLLERARRRRTAAVLRESEENLRRLVETTAAVPWQADPETWMFTYVGPQAVKLLGYPLEQWYQKDFWVSHLHPDDKQFAINTCLISSERTEDFEFEYRMIAASGKSIWVHDIVKCERRNGKPTQLGGFMLDISERKHAEESLRESEERMSLAANAAGLALWMWDVSHDEVWVTPEGRTLFGWTNSDPINFERFIHSLHPDDHEATREAVRRSLESGDDYRAEYRVALSDGMTRWFVARGRVEFDRNHKPVRMRGIAVDITERKWVEEALKQSENQVRLFVEHTPASVAMFDREMRYILASRRWLKDYNLGEQSIIGRSHYEVFPEIPERWKEIHRRCLAGAVETCEQDPFPRLDGTVDWVRWEVRPWYVARGEIGGIIMFTEVITDRKRTESELQLQREELAHLTRVSAMGELAASLAHELNQPLTAILSNAQAAQRFLSANVADLSEVREILTDIVQDNSRASEVIRRMRALVKKEELEFAPLDLPTLIQDIVLMVRSDAILHNTDVLFELDPGLPMVRGDKVQLQQVMLNLLLNAFDAMKDCPARERQVVVQGELDGGAVRVAVRDRGIGLNGDKLDKIFQSFYTTKRDGLGMGLSISRSIIEAHGGRLWAENNPDRGATFYFTLPILQGGKDEGYVAEAVKSTVLV